MSDRGNVKFETLQARLEALALGESEVLSRHDLDQVFRDGDTLDRRKLAAAELAESKSCRVLFTGADMMYVVFTRRQTRRDLNLKPAKRPGQISEGERQNQ